MVSRAAHERLWPYVGRWLRDDQADRSRVSPQILREPIRTRSRRPRVVARVASERRRLAPSNGLPSISQRATSAVPARNRP